MEEGEKGILEKGEFKHMKQKTSKAMKSAYKSVSRDVKLSSSIRVYIFNFFLFACSGCLLPFLPIFFKLFGFSALQNGILVSSRGLVTFWSGPIITSVNHLSVFTNAAVFVCVVGFVIDTFSLTLMKDGFRGGLAHGNLSNSHCPDTIVHYHAPTLSTANNLVNTSTSRLYITGTPSKVKVTVAFNRTRPKDRGKRSWLDDEHHEHRFRPNWQRRDGREHADGIIRSQHRSKFHGINQVGDFLRTGNGNWRGKVRFVRKRQLRRHGRRRLHTNKGQIRVTHAKRKNKQTRTRKKHSKSKQRHFRSKLKHVMLNGRTMPSTKKLSRLSNHRMNHSSSNTSVNTNGISQKPVTEIFHSSRSTSSQKLISFSPTSASLSKLTSSPAAANTTHQITLIQRLKDTVKNGFPMSKIFVAAMVITLLSELFFSILTFKAELVDEIGRYFCPSVFAVNRFWGKLGYSLTAFTVAYFAWHLSCTYTASSTFYFHFYGFVAVGGCCLVASLCLPLKKKTKKLPCRECCLPWRLVLCNLQACTFSLSLIVIGMSDMLADAYLLWYAHDLAENELIFGCIIAMATITDVLFYCFVGISIQWIGHAGLMSFSVLILGSQFLFMSSIQDAWLLIPTQILRGIGTAASRTAIFDFTNTISPLGSENSVQTVLQCLYSGLGFGVGGLYVSVTYAMFGAKKSFEGMFVICLIYGTVYSIVSFLICAINNGQAERDHSDYEKVQPDIIPENDWLVDALKTAEEEKQIVVN